MGGKGVGWGKGAGVKGGRSLALVPWLLALAETRLPTGKVLALTFDLRARCAVAEAPSSGRRSADLLDLGKPSRRAEGDRFHSGLCKLINSLRHGCVWTLSQARTHSQTLIHTRRYTHAHSLAGAGAAAHTYSVDTHADTPTHIRMHSLTRTRRHTFADTPILTLALELLHASTHTRRQPSQTYFRTSLSISISISLAHRQSHTRVRAVRHIYHTHTPRTHRDTYHSC